MFQSQIHHGMACKTFRFYRPIGKVIKIHLILDDEIKVKVYVNQQNSVSYIQPLSRLLIILCFHHELLIFHN